MAVEKIEPGAPESQSADLRAENLARLKALFPELVTERQVDGRTLPAVNNFFETCQRLVGEADHAELEQARQRFLKAID